MTTATKPEITWTMEENGDAYGMEPLSDAEFSRYIEIAEREIQAAFPAYDFTFRTVPERQSLNNRPYADFDDSDDVLDGIANFEGNNWVDWLEMAATELEQDA